jgi:hypothetical protein
MGRLAGDGFSSPMPSTSEEVDEKKGWFASARGSAILTTLTKGISKLSGPRWFQKVLLHARREQLLSLESCHLLLHASTCCQGRVTTKEGLNGGSYG